MLEGELRSAAPIEFKSIQEILVIGFAFTLLIIAAVAAILGFSGLAGALANVAIFIFVLALIAAVVLFVLGRKAAKSLSDRMN